MRGEDESGHRARVRAFFSRDRRLDPDLVARKVAEALAEDLGGPLGTSGTAGRDLATDLCLADDRPGRAVVVAKAEGVLAGGEVARSAFAQVDPGLVVRDLAPDGTRLTRGAQVLVVEGGLRGILAAERTALNVLRRMSGTATATSRLVEALAGTATRVLDTRKTAPGLRAFDKYAVRVGGGLSHRDGLFDLALVKENHVAAAGGLAQALALLRDVPHLVELEVSSVADAEAAAAAGIPLVLLDNMSSDDMRAVVEHVATLPPPDRPALEASGNIDLATAAQAAATGVDYLSSGALTHSVTDLDLSLLVTPERRGADDLGGR